jgi:transposase InsO family protein
MDERLKFIGEWLEHQEAMALLCRRYGISRKTGYKLVGRYQLAGVEGLVDRSRAPHHQPLAVAEAIEEGIVELRGRHPRWGPRKLRAWLEQHRPQHRWPAPSTIGAVLHRHGLTVPRQRRRRSPRPPARWGAALGPNDVWSADFKGWFRTRDGQRCNPLTMTDNASRFLLRCQAVAEPDEVHVRPLFEAAFREYGLPGAMRTDNGPPFASVAAAGLSRLAVWWIKLGIGVQRIRPGHPEDNGRHERFHLTLAEETAQPPQATARAQQRRFDRFRRVYNEERPHEALGQQPPASVYAPSPRPYPDRLPEVEYAADDVVRRVRYNGDIKWRGYHVYVSHCLAGEPIALEEQAEDCWRVWFGPVTLGWLTTRPSRDGAPARRRDASTPKLLPMCPV